MTADPTLVARDLTLRLGDRQALDGVSAGFSRGVVTAIVGPNGAGKSTLLSCLTGLRRPDTGEALLDDVSISALPDRRRAQRMAYMAQSPEIAWDVDVRTFVGLGRTPYFGALGPGAEDRSVVEAAIERTGLKTFAERSITRLSGGERARALIARALAGETDWLVADEPMTGLDPAHALDAIELFRALAHDEGKGVIVTLHDLNLAARFADRVLVLAEGKVVADGLAADALTPGILTEVYGVAIRQHAGEGGPLIEVVGRAG